jgi:hypothetical protein
LAGLTLGGSVKSPIGECSQTVNAQPGFQDDAGPIPTITTVGSATRNELLATKTRTAVTPLASVQFDLNSIYEHFEREVLESTNENLNQTQ